uniref:histidinol-phosphate transaminase n=3 Tax=Phaeomonas parva TaxID=124430 RepID=A0A6U4ISE3_9STRA|mmetsp:Transcript_3917/g.11344  ORF Transcript_3917/g.11344 Transcript_3917/m.11344 type:complete len:212 (+) Transcript_3917:761-1396(+)
MFVTSPGNPTARAISHAQVEELCNSSFDGIIALDEAYVDFSEEGSACHLLDKYPNLIIFQTMSKAFGLAGIRMGMAYASEAIIQIFNNVKLPYSINKLTEEIALDVFDDLSKLYSNIEKIKTERARVMAQLAAFDFVALVHPSDTNFVLFKVPKYAKEVYKRMAESGCVVRYRGTELHCTDCIRATVGTPAENDTFLRMLPQIYAEVANKC